MAHAALRGNGGDLQDCDPVRPQYVDFVEELPFGSAAIGDGGGF